MTTTAIWTMILVCGVVWGGLAGLLVYALRRESGKAAPEAREAEG